MNDLIRNIDRFHTTPSGADRVKTNLQLATDDVVEWCKSRILDKNAEIEQIGKNWYIVADSCRITVNAHSFTIITAHKL